MSYMRHHAIAVTCSHGNYLVRAHARATELGCIVSPILADTVNGYRSFFVAPDGSKEGWQESEDGDARRSALIGWLDAQRYEDGSTPLDWVEVQYGDDEGETKITNHSDEEWRRLAAAHPEDLP